MRQRLLALATCGVLLFAACGTNEEPALEGTPGADETAAAAPAVTVEAAAAEDGVKITAAPENFEVVNKLGQAPAEGEGHIHYYLDVDEIPTTPGQPAVSEEGTYHAEATTTYTWPDVEAGEHTIAVQLVNNDHTPLEPPVTAESTITVE